MSNYFTIEFTIAQQHKAKPEQFVVLPHGIRNKYCRFQSCRLKIFAMFKHLRQLFSSNKPPSPVLTDQPPVAQTERGNARIAEGKAGSPVADVFISREAILGRNQRIAGYEFRHSQRVPSRLMNRTTIRRFHDDALLDNLVAMETTALLGTRFSVIELSPDSLSHPALAQLPKRNLTLLLTLPETAALPASESFNAVLGALREQGATIGWKWQRQCAIPDWMPEPDLVYFPMREYFDASGNVSIHETAAQELVAQIGGLRQRTAAGSRHEAGAAPPLRLIAGELATPTDFSLCYRAGFDLFQGPFINNRDDWKPPKSSINRLRVLQLMNDIRKNSENPELVQELKHDPVLSYRLMRYSNSPAIGLQRQVDTLDQALVALGRDNLYRWLSLLLFHMADPGYREWAYTEQALARATLMECLGRAAGRNELDAMFLTGLFSLLDQLFGEPLSALVSKVQLPSTVVSALVGRNGPLAAFLSLVEACEADDPAAVSAAAIPLGLSGATVNRAVFSALSRASELAELAAD